MDRQMPRFSIIVVHYQGTVSREIYQRGIDSILAQTFKDYELLVYHDGPLLDPDAPTPVPFRCTEKRHDDWGHSLRDRGIREATGDYILHFNADNLIYPNTLQVLDEVSREPNRIFNPQGQALDNAGILIFPIVMHDHAIFLSKFIHLGKNSGAKMIMPGNPPVQNFVDCLQVVVRRDIWLAEGGWSSKARDSDGVLIERLTRKYGYRGVGAVLGEHY